MEEGEINLVNVQIENVNSNVNNELENMKIDNYEEENELENMKIEHYENEEENKTEEIKEIKGGIKIKKSKKVVKKIKL